MEGPSARQYAGANNMTALSIELVARPVDVIFAFGTPIPAEPSYSGSYTITRAIKSRWQIGEPGKEGWQLRKARDGHLRRWRVRSLIPWRRATDGRWSRTAELRQRVALAEGQLARAQEAAPCDMRAQRDAWQAMAAGPHTTGSVWSR